MAPAYNLQVIENCLTCQHRDNHLFCKLPTNALMALQKVKATAVYPKGALLCIEGQLPRGVYVLCTGRAKLFTTSAEGKTVILRIAEPGEVLGLSGAMSDTPYEASVETLEPTQANFISREDFLDFMKHYPDVGVRVAQQLTHNCKCAYDEIRSLGLSNSVPEKIAKLLLHWSERPLNSVKKRSNEVAIRVTLTQEEIAQFTGTSRETVSRVLGDFKRKGWIRITGATWFIANKPALERLVTT
jgi:CRP/FNR family transcriptional regulator